MSVIAFCLLSYARDEPAGIERSVAALAEGCRLLGHRPIILTASHAGEPPVDPDVIPLRSLVLPRPVLKQHILDALADPSAVVDELRQVLDDQRADVVCWADALWGLGYLNAVPSRTHSVLMVHKIRDDRLFDDALAGADLVCPISDYLLAEGDVAGFDTRAWRLVPNALLSEGTPVSAARREHLRQSAPVRIVSRAEPYKGLAELLSAIPPTWTRPVELVLAFAGFEYWDGMQDEVLAACRTAAEKRPDVVRMLPALGWEQVPDFFAGASATVVSSYEPETFCNAAAEALSVGTPVCGFDLGNLPYLTGRAGALIPLEEGFGALWRELGDLLDEPAAYHAASLAAPGQVSRNHPAEVVTTLLAAIGAESNQRSIR
ncbi:hypothetical protein GCM10022252_48040 [Streptosporangium oxazolinicum]|uniref:Glycosyltransferase subfamily 4-like N-terminal domain-containing protein n=1 Tax=Streptosporangium oxazolinicum TaxID=909287 RepID=A0ABP8B4Q0_9ACTN